MKPADQESNGALRKAAIALGALAALAIVAAVALPSLAGPSASEAPAEGAQKSAQAAVEAPPLAQEQQASSTAEPSPTKEPTEDGSADSAQQSAAMKEAEEAVSALVEPYGNDVAVAVVPLDGSLGFDINGEEEFTSASMIKLLILAEFLNEVDSGAISLDDTYTLDAADIVGGTGIMQGSAAGTVYTYDDIAYNMIAYSDNTATNILIDAMGMDAINERARALGLENTELRRRMMDLNSGVENGISASDAASILQGIADRTIANEESCALAESYLAAQTDNVGLAQGIPEDIGFAHKTGSLDPIRHDGGIVLADEPFVIVVLADIGTDAANSLMADIAQAACGILV